MVREFFNEVRVTESRLLAAARSGQEIPQYTERPVEQGSGETEIGRIEDTWLQALCLTFRQRVEQLSDLPIDPRIPAHRKQIDKVTDDLDVLRRIVNKELRTTFGADGDIDIRADWKVVRLAQGGVSFSPEVLMRFLSEGIFGIVNAAGLDSYGFPPETLSKLLRAGLVGVIPWPVP